MWRWPTVQAQKDKNANVKAKVNTLHAKLITLASEKWPDPSQNNALADAIYSAKKDGVTSDMIDRAIRRGAWLDKDAVKVEEIFYEGYAPGGIGIIVRTLTDNRNRTAPSMRHIFSAFWGNLGETGTVSNFAFDYRGVIHLEPSTDATSLEMMIMETPAEDYIFSDDSVQVFTDRTNFTETRRQLESGGAIVTRASFEYIPKSSIEVTDFDNALNLYKMLEEFSENEDVDIVWNNADIPDALWKEVEEYIDARKFRT